MRLNDEQVQKFHDDGFVFFPDYLPTDLVNEMRSAIPHVVQEEHPGKVLEQDEKTVRMVHGIHQDVPAFKKLTQHGKLVEHLQKVIDRFGGRLPDAWMAAASLQSIQPAGV